MSTPYDAPYKQAQRAAESRVKYRGRLLYSPSRHEDRPAKRIQNGYIPW